MRVAIVMHHLGVGGAQRQMVELAKGLAGRGHAVQVITLYPGGAGWDELSQAGGAVVEALFDAPSSSRVGAMAKMVTAGGMLRRRLMRWRADVVYSALYSNNMVAWAASLGARWPLVWGVRTSGKFLSRSQNVLMRAASPLSSGVDLLIANSRVGLRVHQQARYRARRSVAISNGIDTCRFQHDAIGRDRVRSDWGIEHDEYVVGIVARLTPVKDHETFLRSAQSLMAANARIKIVCVGDGRADHRNRLHALASELGLASRLVWAGERSDMCAVYSAIDVAVLSSTVEGFPNAIGEAMACGVPCVGTDVGDTALLMGPIGQVVPASDPQLLAEAILRVLAQRIDDPRIRQGARERIVERFSASLMVDRTERELEKLLAAKTTVHAR